jgi:hypothetical protein
MGVVGLGRGLGRNPVPRFRRLDGADGRTLLGVDDLGTGSLHFDCVAHGFCLNVSTME